MKRKPRNLSPDSRRNAEGAIKSRRMARKRRAMRKGKISKAGQ